MFPPVTIFFRVLCLCAVAATLSGCTTVQFVELRTRPSNPLLERLGRKTFGGPAPSARSQAFLQRTGYRGERHFAQMLRHSRQQIAGPHPREALHTTAEISYLAADGLKTRDRALALELCLDAAQFSWRYITLPTEDGRLIDPSQPQHRETVEIYNTSLLELMKLMRPPGQPQHHRLRGSVRMPLTGRIVKTEIPFPTQWLHPDQLGEYAFVADYELQNLRHRHTTAGIGVPMMVRRARSRSGSALEKYYTDGLTLPITAVARFPDHPSAAAPIRLQLLDPRESQGLSVADTLLPLESDLSTPLAWFLTDPKKSLLETFNFLRPDQTEKVEGLYMVQPYDPDRIPVLMVHGVWSSPMTWMEMFNDLQADPELRDRYQFWFYMYPTGQPLAFAAATLRDRLKEVRMHCDPYGQNQNLDDMVVVGHSMGGLMAYLMTIDSDDRLWNLLSKVPVEKIHTDAHEREQIRRVFFFESDRSIDRIVTIASPFEGSWFANTFTQGLAGSLVSLPMATSRLRNLIFKQNGHSVWDKMFAPRTSIDSLNRHSAILKLVNETSTPDEVKHHNVIGVVKGNSLQNWSDGVVKFLSAQRSDVSSELRVEASHSDIHRHEETIAEVRRILLEHHAEKRRRNYPVVPLGHTPRESIRSAGALRQQVQ